MSALAVTLFLITALTLYAIRVPGPAIRRGAVIGFFLMSVVSVFFLTLSLVGTPKAIRFETLKADSANVLAARVQQGVAIYLWLQVPGVTEPRYYSMPWDENVAKSLHEAMKQQKDGDGLGMRLPFERSWDMKEPKFYAIPQPKMPDKPFEEQKPFTKGFNL